jgi:hypothetical protein
MAGQSSASMEGNRSRLGNFWQPPPVLALSILPTQQIARFWIAITTD